MDELDLKDLQKKYEKARERERSHLAHHLLRELPKDEKTKEAVFSVITRGRTGRGWIQYTSGKRLAEYDLSNWKWVEVTGDNGRFSCVISLNMPEVDPNSGNIHFLYDRIGLYIRYKISSLYYKTDIYTDIDLPLNASAHENDPKKKKEMKKQEEEKKRELVNIILEQFREYNNKKGGGQTQ